MKIKFADRLLLTDFLLTLVILAGIYLLVPGCSDLVYECLDTLKFQ